MNMKGKKGKKIEIISSLKQKVAEIAERNRLTLVMLFGSQSRGDVHQESDVDLAYQAAHPLSVEQEVLLNYHFTEVFGIDRVDTVDISRASPLLSREILDQAVVLYDKTGLAFPTFELHALRSFAEARPLFDMRREKIDMFARAI